MEKPHKNPITPRKRNLTNLVPIPKCNKPVPTRSLPNIILLNARSILNKVDEISIRTKILNPEVLCITETWLNDHIPDEVVQVSGYTIIRKDRANGIRGGGVYLYTGGPTLQSARRLVTLSYRMPLDYNPT
jgi:hypothetical protein